MFAFNRFTCTGERNREFFAGLRYQYWSVGCQDLRLLCSIRCFSLTLYLWNREGEEREQWTAASYVVMNKVFGCSTLMRPLKIMVLVVS